MLLIQSQSQEIPKLKRAHTLLTNPENMVRHKTSCDLEVSLRSTTDCEQLQQLYNEDCINVGA